MAKYRISFKRGDAVMTLTIEAENGAAALRASRGWGVDQNVWKFHRVSVIDAQNDRFDAIADALLDDVVSLCRGNFEILDDEDHEDAKDALANALRFTAEEAQEAADEMKARHFAIVLALARHALYALAALPKDHPQQGPLRWQVQRLENQLREDGDTDRADKLGRLGKWFDDGAVISSDMMVLSEADQ